MYPFFVSVYQSQYLYLIIIPFEMQKNGTIFIQFSSSSSYYTHLSSYCHLKLESDLTSSLPYYYHLTRQTFPLPPPKKKG